MIVSISASDINVERLFASSSNYSYQKWKCLKCVGVPGQSSRHKAADEQSEHASMAVTEYYSLKHEAQVR